MVACWYVNLALISITGFQGTCASRDISSYTWTSWSSWEQCSNFCGLGTAYRRRNCIPASVALECEERDTRACLAAHCLIPLKANYSWSEKPKSRWHNCYVSCGNKTTFDNPACTEPSTLERRAWCLLASYVEPKYCQINPCEYLNQDDIGVWIGWSRWTSRCSNDCGKGNQTRTRKCVRPFTYRQFHCAGEGTQNRPCTGRRCSAEGKWASWSEWSSQCPVTCGAGKLTRRRTCINDNDNDNDTLSSSASVFVCRGQRAQTKPCTTEDCVVPLPACVPNCVTCTHSMHCDKHSCIDGYELTDNGTCRPACIANCVHCAPKSSVCDVGGCEPSHERLNNGSCRHVCTVEYCKNCEFNATICDVDGCALNYVRTEDGLCQYRKDLSLSPSPLTAVGSSGIRVGSPLFISLIVIGITAFVLGLLAVLVTAIRRREMIAKQAAEEQQQDKATSQRQAERTTQRSRNAVRNRIGTKMRTGGPKARRAQKARRIKKSTTGHT